MIKKLGIVLSGIVMPILLGHTAYLEYQQDGFRHLYMLLFPVAFAILLPIVTWRWWKAERA
ncbi:MAG: hypothetical protein JWN89_450 [Parcubacteria group bacterium]|nr:hypothetical protein [Parcubacteria group bacterium]